MRKVFLGEQGTVSFFALCFLCAAVIMASGLLYIVRRGEVTIYNHEEEVQLRLDAEGHLEKAVAEIEGKGLAVEDDLPMGEEILLYQGENERGIRIRRMAKRDELGIYVMAIAESPDSSKATLKSAQGFMERQEDGYIWKCWAH
ncbi:MAG: hypothetical protein IKH16_02870 [Selenomonadaceae bacterium]|nr:hypothetical protein [Selenomonadaceae bacterium]MBR4694463.1 hypothetical protein [Selenomonadaceae bacterium]